jgi:hypothetical protein
MLTERMKYRKEMKKYKDKYCDYFIRFFKQPSQQLLTP